LAAEYTVVALDLAGHGKSGAIRKRWTIRSFAKDVVAVVSQLECPPVILVGHSMGGAVALDAAQALNKCALGVIGVDSLIYPSYSRLESSQIREELAPFKADFHKTVTKLVGDLFAPGADPAKVDWASQLMAAASPQVAIPALRSLLAWDFRPSLTHLTIPVVCICSALLAADVDLTPFNGLIEIELLSNTGHFPMLETTTVFNDTLACEIQRIVAGTALLPVRPT
jgi:pimeloyl-ACP methyl ester carboxylesterase